MNESQLFADALRRAPAERAAYLDGACRGDAKLRASVEALLSAHGTDPGFLEHPAVPPGVTVDVPPGVTVDVTRGDSAGPADAGNRETAGAVLAGRYKLIEAIGEGGMGTVWMAEQTEPVRRRVAVKLIKSGMDSRAVVARFEAERQALALMDHPNIAKVLDAGTVGHVSNLPSEPRQVGNLPHPGRPYFVMELVKGTPITEFCDARKLTPKERLELFVPVCHAIQHAHQKGVIHRDIKPSNVLVALYDDTPVPKVIDFGIAKAVGQPLTASPLVTGLGAVVGTPQYMSPEQASLGNQDIDTRSDVYSLGVLLYELLTGSTPVDRETLGTATLLEVLRRVREVEAPRPSARLSASGALPTLSANRNTEPRKLTALLRSELDWIVLKALEKDRGRRYDTADALARDVVRHLNDEPVEACPPSVWYRVGKFTRKHTRALVAGTVLAASLVAGAAVSQWQAVQANRAKQELRRRLTRQVAERIEGDLGRFAAVGDAMGATAARRTDWTEAELGEWMKRMLENEPKIFGLTLAYEPGKIPWKKGDHLYKCRTDARSQEVRTKVLVYKNGVHEEHWYKLAKDGRRPAWSEPFVDPNFGEVPMVSYVAPLVCGDTFIGVLTVDLSLAYFDQLRKWLTDLDFSPQSYGFALSQTGNVLSHPDPEYDFGGRWEAGHKSARNVTDPASVDPAFAAQARRMLREDAGEARATDPSTGRSSTFLFARVPLDRNDARREWWTFVMVLEE